MRYLRLNKGIVELSEASILVINNQRQLKTTAPEAGGMILGRLITQSDDVVIDEVTEPTTSDRRGRFFFMRSKKHAQQHVNVAWKESNSTRIYLGEWHTHPEDDPTPSSIDFDNWRRIARVAQYEQGFLLFIIAGWKETRIWEFNKETVTELILIS